MAKDKVAVITGASRGIGRSIALALAEAGAKIVAVDLDPVATDAIVAELQEKGYRVCFYSPNKNGNYYIDSFQIIN